MSNKQRTIISIIVCIVLIAILTAVSYSKRGDETPNYQEITIIDGETSEYRFLCQVDASKDLLSAMKALTTKVQTKTNVEFKTYRDNAEASGKEVLVGLTNRAESISVYQDLKENEYCVRIVNENLVIAGKTDALLMLALYEFTNNILTYEPICRDKYFVITTDYCFTKEVEGGLTLANILELGYAPYASIQEMFSVPVDKEDSEIRVSQGACSDGEYFYFLLRDSNDTKAHLYKYDQDGNQVQRSEELYLGHGNDLAWDSKNDYLICAHGVKEANTYSIINKTTLTIERTFTVDSAGGGGSIAYNSKLDLYATSKGGETIAFYDKDFNYITTINREVNGYTAQGIGCDDNYIYCPMSGKTDNVIVVYSWVKGEGENISYGDFVTNVIVNTSAESETMFEINGDYYLSFYIPSKCATLYKLEFTIKYE